MPRQFTFILLLTAIVNQSLVAQPLDFFAAKGNNIAELTCGGIIFAPIQNTYHQAFGTGAAWVKKPIDLRQPFSVNFVLDFIDTTANDGCAFVFLADSSLVGEAYNGLGYRKIDKSIAVTFDPVKNNYDNDPDFDHISIQANGNLDHNSFNNLAGPLPINQFYAFSPAVPVLNFHHLISIKWEPSTKILSVAIDNVPYISVTNDIVQTIFNGNPNVFWGFTGSNTQSIALPPTDEVTFGYSYFFFGDVFPKFWRDPLFDTCYGKPTLFADSSKYFSDYSLQDFSLFKWHWDFGDGTTSSERFPPPHNYPAPGHYELKFTATNQLGCTTDTLQDIISLGTPPKPDFSVDLLCTNSNTKFTDQTMVDLGFPVVWQWDFGNGNESTEKNPIMSFSNPGLKNIHLSVSTDFGCRADTIITILITDKPAIDFTYTKDCEGIVQYNPVISNNSPISNYQWNFGDGFKSDNKNPSHHFFKNDSYKSSLVAISESGCVSDTITKTISINKIYPYAGNDTIIAIGQPLLLQGSGGTIYEWSPSTGLDNPFIENPIAILSVDQAYELLVKNDDGCEGKDSIYIKVFKGPELYVPTAFTPDGNGLNDLFHVTAPGLKQLEYLRVFDRWGKLVFQTKDAGKGWDGNTNGIAQASGVYVWIIKGVDYKNNVLSKKGTVTLIR